MSYRNLKMIPAHYEELRILLLPTALKDARTERQRWDALWAADAHKRGELLNVLYAYLNDDHIDSALRHIVAGSRL